MKEKLSRMMTRRACRIDCADVGNPNNLSKKGAEEAFGGDVELHELGQISCGKRCDGGVQESGESDAGTLAGNVRVDTGRWHRRRSLSA